MGINFKSFLMGSTIELSGPGDTFVDPFLLAICLICVVVLILINIYFLAHYAHHADGGFGSSASTKFVIILAFMTAQSQVLVLSLDVINTREETNIDMFVFWQIIYMTSLFMMVTILPFTYFFYETCEDETYKDRFCAAFGKMMWIIVLFFIIWMPMFVGMRTA